MFPMYDFCFQSYFDVSNVHFLLPISLRCFQCSNFVFNLILMFPMYFFCFQSISMFPTDNVSNPCFQTTYYHECWVQFVMFENRIIMFQKLSFSCKDCLDRLLHTLQAIRVFLNDPHLILPRS